MFFKLRRLFYLLFLFSSSSFLFAQIPNAGFENWTNGNPDEWVTDNIPAVPPFFAGAYPVTQSTDKHSESSSAKLEIIAVDGPYYPYIYSFFPATQKYGSLIGFYKFVPQSNAQVLTIDVWLFKGSNITGIVGFGELETNAAVSAFTQFTVPIDFDFQTTDLPDSAWLFISIDDTSENPSTGTYALIDDLSWGAVVGVNDAALNIPSKFEMQQNYPNPFNPTTTIEYSIPKESFVELKVYDVLGREVSTLVNENRPVGTYKVNFNASGLTSGIYIAKLTAGDFSQSLKMTLMK